MTFKIYSDSKEKELFSARHDTVTEKQKDEALKFRKLDVLSIQITFEPGFDVGGVCDSVNDGEIDPERVNEILIIVK